MKLRKLFTKVNDAVRPVHVQGEGGGADPLLDGKVVARAGNLGGAGYGAAPAPASTDWVPSQQDEDQHERPH